MTQNNWYFGKNRGENKIYREYDLIKSLKPGDSFILTYDTYDKNTGKQICEYALMTRTKCRHWNYLTGKYDYNDTGTFSIQTLNNFYQNFFGLDSNKTFKNIDDPELNLITNIHFGKDACELSMI